VSRLAGPGVDVVITEIGGTVGDIESLPHMEAIRQFALDVGKENCLYIHLTLVPYLKAAREIKTKPTQHSVEKLRQIGIQPDILVCRTEVSISQEDRAKIGLFCNVPTESVIEEKDKDFSIYEVPISLMENKLDQLIVEKLQITNAQEPDLADWYELLHRLRNPVHELTVAVVGEFAEHRDAYKSTYEALDHAGVTNKASIRVLRIPSRSIDKQQLAKADAILVSGGFGETEIEGKIEAVRIARENGIPIFGIDLGMQCAVIEFCRNILNLERSNSTEYDKDTPHPVICLLDEHHSFTRHGGTLRIGANTAVFSSNSRIAATYGSQLAPERFRYRYEFNNQYRDQLARSAMIVTATSPDGMLVQAVELSDHPWFIAVQFHPEFKSQPTKSHPLFAGLIAAAIHRKTG
jgi:CTP synthase